MTLRRLQIVISYFIICCAFSSTDSSAWIRINLLGYLPNSTKVAVWCSKESKSVKTFQLVDAKTKKFAFAASAGKPFGKYGPFAETYRLDFSSFRKPGRYYLQVGSVKSPEFEIGNDVYNGTADFCLRYMRQQRSGFNPFLRDSCHTYDGYTIYGPMPDSTHVDVSGGWHDASDYLQYVTTSANAVTHLLMAYRDFPKAFSDAHDSAGLPGRDGLPDVLNEAHWGLKWLMKMNPRDDWMFNQLADDRDHMGMRIPKEDSFYGKGFERPVYFCSGFPQGVGKYKSRTTGTSSTAAKFASAYALGSQVFEKLLPDYSTKLSTKYKPALNFAYRRLGVMQTAPCRAPYFYEEDNWTDDMELAYALGGNLVNGAQQASYLDSAIQYARKEKITPWLGSDTAKHYQWYPFINLGHYEIARQAKGSLRNEVIKYYKEGIEKVWSRARTNAFFRGVPFIWCSNNLTTSFAIQCFWYRQLSNNQTYSHLEQANFDWLFGCNPWGTSMVYGLPHWGDTPIDPHSAFTHLKNYPIDGGLVDGPVYGSIYSKLIGITLYEPDEYAAFQSDLAVYHDDYGDYSTNEPTMDGTASLVYLLAAKQSEQLKQHQSTNAAVENAVYDAWGAIIAAKKKNQVAIVFTGDEFSDGGQSILSTLRKHKIHASFFLTGRFYRNAANDALLRHMKQAGHYMGAHSDQHLLYCDWNNRDSLLVEYAQFRSDLNQNYQAMARYGVTKSDAPLFLPPYEWYNKQIAAWTAKEGLHLVNFTPGTWSHADYTTPSDKNYRTSSQILESVYEYERRHGLHGFILLMHIGTNDQRVDKLYHHLDQIVHFLKSKNYSLVRIDQLLGK